MGLDSSILWRYGPAIAWSFLAQFCSSGDVVAQDRTNLPLVGVLRLNTPENVEPIPTIFRNALAAMGHVDGRDIRIEFRLAAGHAERFPELAKALVQEQASVIVASGDAAVRA